MTTTVGQYSFICIVILPVINNIYVQVLASGVAGRESADKTDINR